MRVEEPKTRMSDVKTDSITRFITSLTLLSFIFGISNLTIYYSYFSFNVFEYIELNEIVTHTIRDAIYIFIPLGVILFLNLLKQNYLKKRRGGILKEELKGDLNSKKIKQMLGLPEYILIILIIGEFIKDYYYDHLSLFSLVFVLYLVYMLLVLILIKLKKLLKYLYDYEIPGTIMTLSFATIFTLMGSTTITFFNINNVIPKKNQQGTYIIISGDTIKSTVNRFYMGRTKGYVFFYNDSTKATDVYSDKDISKLERR